MTPRFRWLAPIIATLVVAVFFAVGVSTPVNKSEPSLASQTLEVAKATNKIMPTRQKPLPQPVTAAPPTSQFSEGPDSLLKQSVSARMKFARELETRSSEELLAHWRNELTAKSDSFKLKLIGNALAAALRKTDPNAPAVLRQLSAQFLAHESNDYLRASIALILGNAATRDAVVQLLELLKSTPQPKERGWLLQGLSRASQTYWAGSFRADLTDEFVSTWQSAAPDAQTTIGFSLAKIGTPYVLEILFSAIQQGGQTVAEFEQNADDKAWIAFYSLDDVRNPAAVPFLSRQLTSNPQDSIASSAAAFCLSRMGQIEATQALLQFAVSSPMDLSASIADWCGQIRDTASPALVDKTIEQSTFTNGKNKDALEAGSALWHSGHGELPITIPPDRLPE